MRVLQVYRDYFTDLPGGIERHVYDLAHGLSDLGQMDVVVSSRVKRAGVVQDRSVTVHLARELARFQGLPITPGFARPMRDHYDIVHLHAPNPTAELAFALARTPAQGVLTYHADLDRGLSASSLYNGLLRMTLWSCGRVIVSSERLIELSPILRRLRARRPDALEVIPFGVDTERFSPAPTERSLRLRETWGDGPVILFVGRLRHYKGLPHLIEAMRSVEGKLVAIGDGQERATIEDMARDLLPGRFVQLPVVSEEELPDFYRAADVFTLPSTTSAETFGLVVLEAMASGLPVVTTEVGTATSGINIHDRTGLVVPPGDAGALAEAINSLLGDKSRSSAMGGEGRARVAERFERATMLKRVAAVYRGLMASD